MVFGNTLSRHGSAFFQGIAGIASYRTVFTASPWGSPGAPAFTILTMGPPTILGLQLRAAVGRL